MIDIVSVYKDVVLDNVNEAENGDFSYEMFNRLSRRAELRMIEFITGDIENMKPPMPDLSQKNRDWLAPFVIPFLTTVGSSGKISRPSDYYAWDNAYLLGTFNKPHNCESDDNIIEGCNTPITLLSPQKFNFRCTTDIEELRPSFSLPIAKLVGKEIVFLPKDLGSITVEYVRLPKFASIGTKTDLVHNDLIPDATTTINYEWGEEARELLVWFITDMFTIHTREGALKQTNIITGKLVRDQKQQGQ